MTNPRVHAAKRTVQHMSPRTLIRRYSTAQTIRSLANTLGLVYFGYVDQQNDDHQLIRGITVSNTHNDHYYTVGTFKGYDLAIVVRQDTLQYADKRLKDHHWTIVTVDLHNAKYQLPHCYIGHHSVRDEFIAKHSQLSPIAIHPYSKDYTKQFLDNFTVYTRMTHAQLVAALLSPQITSVIGEKFTEMSIEIVENTIYLYKTEKHPSKVLLEKMINNGLWLAEAIDQRLGS
ncbi:hypothetical protein EOL96_09710 [Candidatus Saccharibacteria bacterium]|nr:hypothetical protein [Candidatus Saccharibacteria bacterium]